jgi:hypothetical protein
MLYEVAPPHEGNDGCAQQEIQMTAAVRDLAFGEIWNIVQFGQSVTKVFRARRGKAVNDHSLSLDDLRMWLMYAVEHPTRKKDKPTMTNEQRAALVQAWIPIIRGLSTAHDKATVDQCEFDMERHLMPMLSAPVKQLRQFYADLVEALKADPTIPFFVWAMFQSWGDVILKEASDEDVRELKKELAAEIADMVEEDVRPDVGKAIAGALQWRSPETLVKVRDAVKAGSKARLVGKESCLFMQVEVDGQPVTVML